MNPALGSRLEEYLKTTEALAAKTGTITKVALPFGASMFGALNSVDAQIVYSGVQNIAASVAGNTNRAYINIDQAGGNDLEIHRNHAFGNQFIQIDEVIGGGFSVNGFNGQVAGTYVYPYALAANAVIGAAGPWGFQAGQANSLSEVNNAYPNDRWTPLANGTTRFVGFRGTIGGSTKYGWIRLTKNAFGSFTVVDWAYNNNSGQQILAGQTSLPTSADISVSKSVFPTSGPSGTTVTYTITVTNLGPDQATGVEITDIVPAGMTYVPGSITGAGTYVTGSPSGTGLKWQNITLANGASTNLTFQATVN